jgi:hypothetical protein
MTFLLVWDKNGYTGSFLVLFPCIYALRPQLVHLFQSSSLLPSPLPMVALASLRFLYSFLYSEHINHIQVFGSHPLPYPSHVWPPISVTRVFWFTQSLGVLLSATQQKTDMILFYKIIQRSNQTKHLAKRKLNPYLTSHVNIPCYYKHRSKFDM